MFRTAAGMAAATRAAAYYACVVTASQLGDVKPEHGGELKHHAQDGKGFMNPWESWQMLSAPQIMKAMVSRRLLGKANNPDTTPPTIPVHAPAFLQNRETPKLRATWLGHACYYVEFPGGLRVLFDPVFEHRCSPIPFLGPARYTRPPCQIDDIPFIDVVVISHNHYDHLSYPTVKEIKAKHPNVHFFAPLGNKKWFVDAGIHNVTELDWWETREVKLERTKEGGDDEAVVVDPADASPNAMSATIGCLPCQHISARTLWDRALTLWASWSIESGGKKVWFGGDTGYRSVPELPDSEDDYDPKYDFPHCPAFKEIGELRGPFDLGLIPIGAYKPRFLFSSMHADPFDAVNIFKDTKCQRAMGIHWGTWVLTEEDVLEPPQQLKVALQRQGMPETGVFDVCDIGETREF
ncbi:Metallo-hydrolase/oxidoreductase [Trichodelitschia bisporula]|uniref:Metallo-hydrolase/oxidoreductase n=1 Tax=Trichodelitschia bisporula TaxID=703511 RepID=A0A6G1HQQ0_9PEZI|nr:Metallo-hydrolase/oxidoreductase [Trichodelitschia bisporula]